jgi:1-acyl-sn-glycerol-3-phosphate acyltransferase
VNPTAWIILSFLALLAWAFLVRWLLNNPRGDLFTGIFYRLMKLDAFVFHRLRVFGRENIPDLPARHPGPLIVVINHTAGIDPVLVQAALHFEVRWMMARDMMVPALKALWDWSGAIPVDRGGRDTGSARDAIRYVRSGHAIGIFPEGGIERPPRTLLPFHPGVGFIIAKTEASVLPVIVEGTPVCPNAWGSLYTRGRARVTFLPLRTYAGLKPAEITAKLQQDYLDATGWPLGERGDELLA